MVEILPEETKVAVAQRPQTSTGKRKRKTVVWSVNVLTVVMYMIEPR